MPHRRLIHDPAKTDQSEKPSPPTFEIIREIHRQIECETTGAIGELPKAEEVAVVAHAIKGLVERGEALLAIQDEEGVLRAVKRRGAFELAGREHTLGITHTQDAPSRIVVRDRNDQLLGGVLTAAQ